MKRETKQALNSFAQTPVGKPLAAVAATVMMTGLAARVLVQPSYGCKVFHGETCRCRSRN